MVNFTNELRAFMDKNANEFQSMGFNQLDMLDKFFADLITEAWRTGEAIEFPNDGHFLMCVQAGILAHGGFDKFLRLELGCDYVSVDIVSESAWASLASMWLNHVRAMHIPEESEYQTYYVTVTEIKKVADNWHDKF